MSTRIDSSSAPFGFSLNSMMRPLASVFNKPKSLADIGSLGITETVTSASVSIVTREKFPVVHAIEMIA